MWREKKKEEEKEKEEEKRKKNVTCRERMEYHDEQEIRNGREKEKMGTVHVRAYLCIPLGAASPFPNSHRPNASPFRSYHW